MGKTNHLLKSLGINKPTLILDEKKAKKNIAKMVTKAEDAGVQFRPHFKTHQSAEIGNWVKEVGTKAITVSSFDMAVYFAQNGWDDITVAFPVNLLEIEKINTLAKSIHLNILVDSEDAVVFLGEHLNQPVKVWIKIDVDYGRVGIPWQDFERITNLVEQIQTKQNLEFLGILTHFGQCYNATNKKEILQIYHQSMEGLVKVKSNILNAGIPKCSISVGDTPSCSFVTEYENVDEIRPGNFIFYDLQQNQIGACDEKEIAVAVACPIVGKYEARQTIAIYGGAVHFSKDFIIDEKGDKVFGYLTLLENESLGKVDKRGKLISVSQEHGLLRIEKELFNQLKIGDLVLIFPVHSCLTANLYNEYHTLDGKVITRFQSLD